MTRETTEALDDRLPGRLQATFWPGDPTPSDGRLALWGRAATDDLVEDARRLGFPVDHDHVTVSQLPTVLPRTPRAYRRVAPADVPALLIEVLPAVRVLAGLPAAGDWPAWKRPSATILAWRGAAALALEHVVAGRVVPVLHTAGDTEVACWRAAADDGRLAHLADAFPPAAHAVRTPGDPGAVWAAEMLLAAFCDAVADACVTTAGASAATLLPTSAPRSEPAPRAVRDEARFADALDAWAAPLTGGGRDATARLCLRLSPPDPPDTGADDDRDVGVDVEREGDTGPWRMDYLLQAADDPSLLIPAADVWDSADAAVLLGARRIADAQETLVTGLAGAARLFAPIDASLADARPTGIDLDAHQTSRLLARGAADLAAAGIQLLLPSELTVTGRQRLRARLRVGAPATPGVVTDGGFDADTLAAFRWEVALGTVTLTAAQFATLVARKQPLVRWRGQWVRIDPDEATRLADLTTARGELSVPAALTAGLAGTHEDPELGTVEVVADGALADLLERLRTAPPPQAARTDLLDATLRGYQTRGVAWLQAMADLGFGTVLADDMGLGKTLQTIGLLADRAGDRPHLVVCPTSVVGNWERELARFCPALPVIRHHGADRPDTPDGFAAGSVAITSYGTLRRDAAVLAQVDWDVVVLDEAQQIKNHASRGAKAARALPAAARVALTGTPVENRLAELWAILDWANPGLLGSFTRFRERYAVPIERWHDPEAAARLKRLTAPFVLRRVKADPAVAGDLPDKLAQTTVCGLTREQATLYQAAVDAAFADDLGEGIERRGRILKLLTGLKQICNHPAQYLHESGPLPARSGKLARLEAMVADVIVEGDRALVFTQYRRMGHLLARHLAATLDLPEVPFLHGGLSRTARQRLVDAFQDDPTSPPVLLLSLKAGGTGLNLTAATEVFHYDRWWNPAVEDQASDRAYRIGQHRTVTVHTLVTAGTLEERIAEVLDRKRALADAVVGTGEAWLTELSDDELRELVDLNVSDVTDDEDEEAVA